MIGIKRNKEVWHFTVLILLRTKTITYELRRLYTLIYCLKIKLSLNIFGCELIFCGHEPYTVWQLRSSRQQNPLYFGWLLFGMEQFVKVKSNITLLKSTHSVACFQLHVLKQFSFTSNHTIFYLFQQLICHIS